LELRKKKDVMSEERKRRVSRLSRDEKTSRNNPKSIYSDEGEESRDIPEIKICKGGRV
jgi:hypothetical protein